MKIVNMDKRRRLALALLALIAALIVGPLVSIPAKAASVALLPGEPLWGSTPAYLYGVNDGVNWDPAYNMDVAPDGPVIQAQIKAANVPIARTWFFQHSLVDGHAMSDAEQLQKLHAVQAAGMICFADFPTANTVAYDLHLLSILGGACPYVEVMNEPDIEGVNSTAYLAFWNSFVPQARAAYPGTLFGGPADYNNQGNECTYTPTGTTCFLQKVLIGMAASGNLPDFVTYHWYPCWNMDATTCMAQASGFAAAAAPVIGWTQQYFPGKSIPVICSEWNADPGNPSYMDDGTWMGQFVTTALASMQTSGLAGAMEYDVAGYANWGTDDMFNIYINNGQPKGQFTAFAAAIAAARGGTPPGPTPTPVPPTPTPVPPTPTPTQSPTSTPTPLPTPTSTPTSTPTPAPTATPRPTPTSTPLPPTPSSSPTPPPGGLTFSDGFESGNTNAWTETNLAGLNTLAVESSNAHSGKYALGMVKKPNQGDVYIQENLARKGLASAQTRWAVELTSPKGRGMLQLAQWDTGAGGQYFLAGLWLTYNTSTGYTNLELLDGNYVWHKCALPTPLYGAWHTYSLTYTGAHAKRGAFSLSIDGKVACAASGIRTARTGNPTLTAVQFGSIGSEGGTGMAIWLDDVTIAPAA